MLKSWLDLKFAMSESPLISYTQPCISGRWGGWHGLGLAYMLNDDSRNLLE